MTTALHGGYIHPRRVRILAGWCRALVPKNARVLDVGTGDGRLARALIKSRPDLHVQGIDTLIRGEVHVPTARFDGMTIPFPDGAFDTVLLVDVLHHAGSPELLLQESVRVCRSTIIIKDHLLRGVWSRSVLRFMDWISNARHGVILPYNYWSEHRWHEVFSALGLKEERWITKLRLYPWPTDYLFGDALHFIARCSRS